jgi:hypothetical protein
MQFFIYIHAELNSQWFLRDNSNRNNSSNGTSETTEQTNKTNNKKQGHIIQLRLFPLAREFLKISAHMQTAPAAETHRTEGQWREEQ